MRTWPNPCNSDLVLDRKCLRPKGHRGGHLHLRKGIWAELDLVFELAIDMYSEHWSAQRLDKHQLEIKREEFRKLRRELKKLLGASGE